MKLKCSWSQDQDGNWLTDCDNIFVITEGTPSENDMKFCCYCGEELAEHRFDTGEDA
ncbi:MAG TPA: hypothetical protein VN731_10345 [Rhodanobacter sp.]|nr:hypothetical protein [Rhodanobacter sp.]